MPRLPFETALLLAPLAYVIHHFEEHVVFDFRAWRLRYFADNNALSTEAIVCVLVAILMIYLLVHASLRSRVSGWMAVLFLMATQVHNIFFHVGGTVAFQDFSPGTITAVAVYAPVNALILHAALAEGRLSWASLAALFVAGGVLFWAFEFAGPAVPVAATLASWAWIALDIRTARPAAAKPA